MVNRDRGARKSDESPEQAAEVSTHEDIVDVALVSKNVKAATQNV